MRKFSVCFSILFFYCVSDTALDPESVSLISPKNLESCTNSVRINDTDRQVRFEWTKALNVDQYELIVENSITKEKFISNTPLLNSSLVISAGAPYSWFVRSKSDFTTVTKNSEVWEFYLERIPNESHIPFPASLLYPLNNSSVSLTNENQILFRWKGLDLDNERRAIDVTMTKLRSLCESTGIALILVSHLRRPQGQAHEEGREISTSDLKGSSGLLQLSDVVLGASRNQVGEASERQRLTLKILKSRHTGMTGEVDKLLYDQKRGRLEVYESIFGD